MRWYGGRAGNRAKNDATRGCGLRVGPRPVSGVEEDRTLNLLDATEALFQLSYHPNGERRILATSGGTRKAANPLPAGESSFGTCSIVRLPPAVERVSPRRAGSSHGPRYRPHRLLRLHRGGIARRRSGAGAPAPDASAAPVWPELRLRRDARRCTLSHGAARADGTDGDRRRRCGFARTLRSVDAGACARLRGHVLPGAIRALPSA